MIEVSHVVDDSGDPIGYIAHGHGIEAEAFIAAAERLDGNAIGATVEDYERRKDERVVRCLPTWPSMRGEVAYSFMYWDAEPGKQGAFEATFYYPFGAY